MLERRYAEEEWPWRESVGRAVMMEELVSASIEKADVGVQILERGWRPRPVIVIWEGRDLSVCMSIPEMERMDSWEVERRRVGWSIVDHSSWISISLKFASVEMSDGVVSSSNDGTLGVWRSRIPSMSSSSSWMTFSGWKFTAAAKLLVETSEPRFRCLEGAKIGDVGSILEPGDVGRDESISKPLSNKALCRYIDCGELGTEDGVKSDIPPEANDQRFVGVKGAGMVTDVCERIVLAVSWLLPGVIGAIFRGGVKMTELIAALFFFVRRTSSFFGPW